MTCPTAHVGPAEGRPARRGAIELLLLAAFTACLLGWLSAAGYAACLGLDIL